MSNRIGKGGKEGEAEGRWEADGKGREGGTQTALSQCGYVDIHKRQFERNTRFTVLSSTGIIRNAEHGRGNLWIPLPVDIYGPGCCVPASTYFSFFFLSLSLSLFFLSSLPSSAIYTPRWNVNIHTRVCAYFLRIAFEIAVNKNKCYSPVGGRGEEERRRVFQLRHSSACLREKPKVKPCENMDDSPIDFPFVPFVSPSFIPRCFTPFSLSLVLLCFFLQLFLSLNSNEEVLFLQRNKRGVAPSSTTIQWFRVDPNRLEANDSRIFVSSHECDDFYRFGPFFFFFFLFFFREARKTPRQPPRPTGFHFTRY